MKVYLVMYREDTDYNTNDFVDSVYLKKENAEAQLEVVRTKYSGKWWFTSAWVSEEEVKDSND